MTSTFSPLSLSLQFLYLCTPTSSSSTSFTPFRSCSIPPIFPVFLKLQLFLQFLRNFFFFCFSSHFAFRKLQTDNKLHSSGWHKQGTDFSLTANRLQLPWQMLEPFPLPLDLLQTRPDSHHLDFYQAKVGVESLLVPHLSWDMDGKRLLWIHSPSLPHQSSISSLSVIKWKTFTPDLLIHQNGTLWGTEAVLITFWANSCWLA